MLAMEVTAVAPRRPPSSSRWYRPSAGLLGQVDGQRTESWSGVYLPDTVGAQDDGGESHRATAEPGVLDALVHRGGANDRRERQSVAGKIAS
jgi:hypothetical protein